MMPFYYECYKDGHFCFCVVAIGPFDLTPPRLIRLEAFRGMDAFEPSLVYFEEVHEFSTSEGARQFIKEWWSKQ